MSLSKYETFLEVAKTQNMSKAAANTHQTVPGVSYAIARLEEELGLPLFVRSRGRISLTEAGEGLLPYMAEILNAQQRLEEAAASMKGMEWGTVRVGGLRSVTKRWLPGILKDMNRQYPNIHIEIILNLYEEIENNLTEGVIDVAFAGEPSSKMLEFHHMVDDPYVVVMAKSHPLAERQSISLEELKEEKFILPNWSSDREIMGLIGEYGLSKQTIHMIKDVGTIVSMVENHLGLTVLPRFMIANETAEISAVPLSDWPPGRFGIVTAATGKCSPSTRKFVECTKNWIKNKKSVDISGTTW